MSTPPLPGMRRIVTSHNERGEAIVALDSEIHSEIQPHGAGSAVIWSSESSPAVVDTNSDHALAATEFVNNGSIFRVVDVPPRTVGLLHRSLSLDYIIVQYGSITLTLDSGTRTKVHPGEFVIQQATMHGWDNDGDEWVRLIAIMLPARAPRVGDRELGTDLSALFGPGS